MANLSDLTANLARVTGLPEATVFAYGRFAREAGQISQKGRGRGAAVMTLRDAANLLIAVAGTAITREAPSAIRDFSNMRAHVYVFRESFESTFFRWLGPLGLGGDRKNAYLKSDFGDVLEFLLREAANGNLARLLRGIPTTEIPPTVWKRWQKSGKWPASSIDDLVEKGHLKTKKPDKVVFGEDVRLEVKFDRSLPLVDVDISRMWDNIEQLLEIQFVPKSLSTSELFKGAPDLRVATTVTQNTLSILGLTVADVHIPPGLRTEVDFTRFLELQEHENPSLPVQLGRQAPVRTDR